MARQSQKKSSRDYTYWGIGLGSVCGVALAVALKDPIYFVVGLILGLAIGSGLDQKEKRKAKK